MTEWTPQWQWAADCSKPWCRQQRKISYRALTFGLLARRTLTSWKIWGAVVTPTARPVVTAQRYAGARLCLHLNTRTQSLYWILSWIRSQCRSISIVVICSDFLAEQISLAAALMTAWSRSIIDLLCFYTIVVHPVLEYAYPVWHSSLTIGQHEAVESLQKRAMWIIFNHDDYFTCTYHRRYW